MSFSFPYSFSLLLSFFLIPQPFLCSSYSATKEDSGVLLTKLQGRTRNAKIREKKSKEAFQASVLSPLTYVLLEIKQFLRYRELTGLLRGRWWRGKKHEMYSRWMKNTFLWGTDWGIFGYTQWWLGDHKCLGSNLYFMAVSKTSELIFLTWKLEFWWWAQWSIYRCWVVMWTPETYIIL